MSKLGVENAFFFCLCDRILEKNNHGQAFISRSTGSIAFRTVWQSRVVAEGHGERLLTLWQPGSKERGNKKKREEKGERARDRVSFQGMLPGSCFSQLGSASVTAPQCH